MENKLTFITASAGTGKTFRLVEEVKNAVRSGESRPEAVIATTFTRASANELQERLSSAFHADGMHDESARLESDALISTVHGICFRILERFAFEAGISPDIRVIDESEAKMLLDRSIDEVVDESVRQKIYALAGRLKQKSDFRGTWNWRRDVKQIVENARSNDIGFSRLPAMGKASWEEMQAELGEPFPPEIDLDQQLRNAIQKFLDAADGDAAKGTSNCRVSLAEIFDEIGTAQNKWSSWEKVSRFENLKPGVKYKPDIAEISDVAVKVGQHPQLQGDIRDYITLLFDLGQKAGERFSEAKTERGTADYADLEKATLDLLRENESVRTTLSHEIDLLLVDEFQDTSPIQLALFTELGNLANRVLWVGDVKQSIYGFRGSDPELVFEAASGAANRETLGESWRSVPDLVTLTNSIFAPVFHEELNIPESQTAIDPVRAPLHDGPVVEYAELSSGLHNKDSTLKALGTKKIDAIANAVSEILERADCVVGKKGSVSKANPVGEFRPLQAGDIAILVRKGRKADEVAAKLRSRGFDVSLSGAGLLSTPEATFALACLRRWIDPTDSLAAAEIVSMEGMTSAEAWIDHRLEYLAALEEGSYENAENPWLVESSPALAGIHRAQGELGKDGDFLAPLEHFQKALSAADAETVVTRWGPGNTRASQRLGNLEKLLGYVADYQQKAADFGLPATLNGLFGWLADLEESEEDKFPKITAPGAITVSTYHGVKGLEWPVVFMSDLDEEPRTRLFSLRVVRSNAGEELDRKNPLAGRELRQWIQPFGGGSVRKKNPNPVIDILEDSPTGQAAQKSEHNENLRLLYVGFTRARDRLIFLHEARNEPKWLATLGETTAETLLSGGAGAANRPVAMAHHIHLPDTDETSSAGETDETIDIPKRAERVTERLPASLTPSSTPSLERAIVTETTEFGQRLKSSSGFNERDFGDAMHRILAAEVQNPPGSDSTRKDRVREILEAFDLQGSFEVHDVATTVARYRKFIVDSYAPIEEKVEVPFTVTNASGQIIQGYIDHLLILPDGKRIIIDHKIFPGKRSDWEAKALSYSGQLQIYASVLELDKSRVETAIHMVTAGCLIGIACGLTSS